MYSLTEFERAMYCDLEFYKLMKVVMIADSESYDFIKNQSVTKGWRSEFIRNNTLMAERWRKFWSQWHYKKKQID